MNFKLKTVKDYLIIVLVTLFIISIPYWETNIISINHQREGCERLNTVRISLYGSYNDALKFNKYTIQNLKALDAPKKELKLSEKVSSTYQDRANNLVISSAQYAVHKGSVRIDCSDAYPYPWPFN
jgi:hypothetical protein